jgi:hypothetical protein
MGEWMYRSVSLTSALVGDEWSASRSGRFTPWKELPVPIGYKIGWAPEPVWRLWKRENSWPYRDSNSDLSVVKPVASRYTDCASTAPVEFFFQWLYSPLGLWLLIFRFTIILQTVGLIGRVISSSQGLYLNTRQHKHRINTYRYQTSMPCVGFEPMIPVSKRTKTVHALDRSATVTGPVELVTSI